VFCVLQLNNVESYCERVEYSLTYLSFTSFSVTYGPKNLVLTNLDAKTTTKFQLLYINQEILVQ